MFCFEGQFIYPSTHLSISLLKFILSQSGKLNHIKIGDM